MGQSLSNFDAVLKDLYLGPIRKQLNSKTVLLTELERDEENIEGRNALLPASVSRNLGIGARAENATLPTAGQQGYEQIKIPMRYNYGRIQVSGPTIAASKSNKGAFVKAVDSEIKGLVRDLRKDINRQMHSDGTGFLCKAAGADDATPANVDPYLWAKATKYIDNNMVLELMDTDLTTVHTTAGITINGPAVTSTAIAWDAGTQAGSAAGDYYGRYGSVVDGGVFLEITGLAGIIDDGNILGQAGSAYWIHNIDATATTVWQSKVYDNSGTNRALTLSLMQEAYDAVEEEGGGTVSFILTSYALRRKFVDLLVADKRFVNTDLKLDGGYKGVEFNGIGLVPDTDSPSYRMNFVDKETLKIYRMSDFDWMDKDGAILNRVSGVDAYEATLYLYAVLGCEARNRNSSLRDLTE